MAATAGATPAGLTRIPIPGAYWRENGPPLRELALRPASEDDELFLVDASGALNATERATALLARCLASSAQEPDSAVSVSSLGVGDREACLLHLRRLTLGDRIEAVMRCPVPDCGELMELVFSIDELLVPPGRHPRREHRLRVGDAANVLLVRFRLPTSGDLAAVASASGADAGRGADELLRRCVTGITQGGRSVPAERLDEAARAAISEAMAEADPQALVEMELTCPACGESAAVLFDSGAYLVAELEERAAQLLEEVHTLALHYHWAEAEILAMPEARRARYLALLGAGTAGLSAQLPVPTA